MDGGVLSHRAEAVPVAVSPKTIPVVAGFLFLATGMAWIAGLSLLFPASFLNRLWALNPPAAAAFRSVGWIAGALLLALGVATAAAGIGLLRRQKWAWWFAVVLFAINGCGDLVSFLVLGDLLRSAAGVVVAGAFLYFLTRRASRSYFATGTGARLAARVPLES